eukprot:TRINITY_DN21736_c0_g1_i3.p1 TRINITY_DN21736_c0_g1~~TRINITY_DN21736_c0_g1_i3.p1  ORF type:complete len:637 (+),score=117.03 TRINITY_DN21736_c0_g1_i3:45-1955(+)
MAAVFPSSQAIVVGGGLAGMSAANTVLENGGGDVLTDGDADAHTEPWLNVKGDTAVNIDTRTGQESESFPPSVDNIWGADLQEDVESRQYEHAVHTVANMASNAENLLSQTPGFKPAGGDRQPTREFNSSAKDSDLVDAKMLRELLSFMQKRAERATHEVPSGLSDTLVNVMSNSDAAEVSSIKVENVVKAIVHECRRSIDRTRQSEISCTAAIHKSCEQDVLRHSSFKEAVDKETGKMKDGALPKAVLKAVESRTFAESFVDACVGSNAAKDFSSVSDALHPSRVALQQSLVEDLRQPCADALTKLHQTILPDGTLGQSRNAIDRGMKEVIAQTDMQMTNALTDICNGADSTRLARLCASEVAGAVRREAAAVENSHLRTPAAAETGGASASAALARRLQRAAAPLLSGFDASAEALRQAGTFVKRGAAALEPSLAAVTDTSTDTRVGLMEEEGFEEMQRRVTEAVDAGSLAEAFGRALQWDASHQSATVSLMELVCQHARCASAQNPAAGTSGDELSPDEVLQLPSAKTLDGRIRLLLTHALLRRIVAEGAPVARVEANLEWVSSLLSTSSNNDADYLSGLEAGRQRIEASLESLCRAEAPAALAQADAAVRRRVAAEARLALRSLSVLLRVRS